ncbi:hypothetical protein [Priestia megaterium]|uniref:hypothetical protein n=1 Tax=Priestia megaterium TaxID=1404 RepID=UPI002E238E76|nr:hypothetical protein [Priestia megaterium]
MKTNVKNGLIYLGKIDSHNSEIGHIGGLMPSYTDFMFSLEPHKAYIINGETNQDGIVERIIIECIPFWYDGMEPPKEGRVVEIDDDEIIHCEGKL